MIEVWKAKGGLPDDMLPGPLGHSGGLLCRRHAQHSMRMLKAAHAIRLEERIGDLSLIEVGCRRNRRIAEA